MLGVLLFLLYINDIETSCTDCTVKLFADDTNLFVYHKTVSDAYCKANRAILICLNGLMTINLLWILRNHVTVFGRADAGSLYNITLGSCNLERV